MAEYLLNNVDSLDTADVIRAIEGSLGIEFGQKDLENVQTYGEFCEAVSVKVKGESVDDCTTQQAFYKLREQVSRLRRIDKADITPASRFDDLLPLSGRRLLIRQLKDDLTISMSFLRPKNSLVLTLLLGFLASGVALFFSWRSGLAGMGICILGLRVAYYFGKEFSMATIGEAAKEMTRVNYIKSRRNPQTFNDKEIEAVIRDSFCRHLALSPEVLTPDARF
jgi:hypothetical protein